MSKKNQDKIFFQTEGDKFFERNGPKINQSILKTIKFLKPKKNSNILEIGCGCGSTLKEINKLFQSNVFGIDTSKKAIDFAINKNGLNNMFHDTFLSFKSKKNLTL